MNGVDTGQSRKLSAMSNARGPRPSVATHLGVMGIVAVIMGVLAGGLAIPFAGVAGLAAKEVSQSVTKLPAELETKDLAQKTTILDANGNVMASLYDQNRTVVGLRSISRKMIEAILSIEDYRFYQHGALDMRGTLRAFVSNQTSGSVQGGSSITQQLVKQTLLAQAETKKEQAAATEDTYARKLRELRYAIAFERKYSKDWILERYLNIAYFGDGAHGIQSAARHYFSKNARNLNYLQSATLAGLVKNPTGYDPTNSPERALNRRNVVLDRMAQLGVLPAEQVDKLKQRPLGLKIEKTPNGCQQSTAPFFCDYVVNWLEKDRELGDTVKDRRRLLQSGGLTIRTTLDPLSQKSSDAAVANHVYPTDLAIGGMAMVEPGTGDLKALSQSRPMGKNKKAGQTYLNFVVPKEYGDAEGFQAGSTFKPFVLAAAINQGIPLSTYIEAPEERIFQKEDFADCDDQPYSYGEWPVENSTGSGSYNLYDGTQKSVNTFYAELESRTGICEPFELAKAMGIKLTSPGGDKDGNGAEFVASFVLGVANTSPLEMAEAYATFGARGLHCDTRPVTQILDSDNQVLKDYPESCETVMPGVTADAVNDVLRGVMEPGGFGQNIAPSVPSAGKTGTIQGNRAVWFAGYTPQMAAVAMVAGANETGFPITLNGTYVGGSYIGEAFGSTVAGPIWGEAMAGISSQLDYEDFETPPGDEVAGVLSDVPDVVGLSVDEATAELEAAGFSVATGGYVNSETEADLVAATSPEAGTPLASEDVVTLYQSTGSVPEKPKKGGKGKNKNARSR